MPKNKKIILIVLITLAFFGVLFLRSSADSKPAIVLDFKDTFPGNLTVYDFMNKLKNEGKINFTEKNFMGMGEFIDSIGGVKGNPESSWIYYVNGVEAQVGVSNYKIKPGDIVSWKYEKANF